MATELKAKLLIDAEVDGQKDVAALASELDSIADKGGEAAPKFKALGDELRRLGQQQKLIDQFSRLKDETGNYAQEAQRAQAATKASALELKRANTDLQAAAAAEADLTQALSKARQEHAQISEVVREGRSELRELSAASKAAGEGATAYADRIDGLKGQLAQMVKAEAVAADEVKRLAQEQRDAARATKQLGSDARVAQAAFDKNRQAAVAANRTYGESRVALQGARDALSATGVATNDLAHAQVTVRREMDQAKQSAKALADEHGRTAAAAQAAASAQQTAHRKMSEKVQSISKELAMVRNGYVLLQGLMAASGAFGGLIQTADAYGQMAERIRMATKSQEEYELVQQRILASANTTYRGLAEQQEMYIRSAEALKALGYDTQQVLDITDSFSYLLATNAASAEKGAAAIDAYTKSMQAGRVESDAWQSILAATPTIVDAIAKATGKTTAEIRAMGVAGRLSVTDLNEGLRQTVDANKAATEGMVTTVNDAMTRLKNTWSVYIGEANRANGSTQRIVGTLNLLSENLNSVVNIALTAGNVLAAVWGVRALQALATYTASLRTATLATQALTAESLKAATAAEKIGMAGKLAAAGWIGWEIGTYLREEFEVVQKAGIALASGLHKSAAYAKAGWEALKGAFTDAAIEQAQDRLREKLREIDDGYAELFASAGKAAEQQDKQSASTAKSAAAADNAVTKWETLRKSYEAVHTELERLDAGMEARNKLREAEVNATVTLAQAIGTETEIRKAQAEAAVAQAAIAATVAKQRQTEVDMLIAERTALQAVGAEILASDPVRRKQLEDLNQQILLRQKVADVARVQAGAAKVAAAAAEAEAEALKDNSARVSELGAAYREARIALDDLRERYAQGKVTAEQLAAGELKLVNASRMYRDALNDQRRAIEAKMSLTQATLDVESAGVRLAIEQQQRIGQLAKARGDETTAMRAANEQRKLEVRLAELAAAAKRIEADAALKKAELQKKELIANGEYNGVKKEEIEAAIKSAEAKGLEAEAAELSARKMKELAAAQKESADSAKEAADAADELKKKQQEVTAAFEYTWVTARAAASKYRDEAVRHADEIEGAWQSVDGRMINSWQQWNDAVNNHFALLGRLADEYASALDDIDARQQKLNDTNSGAARGVADLELRLIELNGTEDEIARARYERDQAEVKRQIALQKLELERAAIRGEDATRIQQEIDLLNKQLGLMERVFNAEKKQKNSKSNSGGTGSTGESGGGGVSTKGGGTFNITLNANGINDPVQLARQLVPELKKLDRLAR